LRSIDRLRDQSRDCSRRTDKTRPDVPCWRPRPEACRRSL
jgi:hypothetical protein